MASDDRAESGRGGNQSIVTTLASYGIQRLAPLLVVFGLVGLPWSLMPSAPWAETAIPVETRVQMAAVSVAFILGGYGALRLDEVMADGA